MRKIGFTETQVYQISEACFQTLSMEKVICLLCPILTDILMIKKTSEQSCIQVDP